MAKRLQKSSDYSDFFNNLIEICNLRNTTPTALAEKYASKSVLTAWKNGTINTNIVSSLALELNVSLDYLLTGEEKSPSLLEDEQELLNYYKALPAWEQQRLIGRAAALAEVYEERQQIQMTSVSEDATEYVTVHYFNDPASAGTGVELGAGECEDMKLQSNTITQKADIVIRVKGSSMEPQFYDNDLVVVRLTPSVEVGEIGIFRIGGEKGVIKKKGTDRLISLNPDYEDIYYDGSEEIDTIGRVVGVLKPEWIIR